MTVNRSNFLLIAAALAAGGVGGTGCDTAFGRAPPAPAPAAASVVQPGPVTVDIILPAAVSGAPVCDDAQGTPEDCPSVGPSDEGGCRNIITQRCNDFKASMKPRIAAQAVTCLRALKGGELCDVTRVNQCGHAALMSACQETPRPQKGQLQPATGAQLASVTILVDPIPDPSPVTAACSTILRNCGEKASNPTLADCRQTLAGLNDTGRANMVDCVSAHCSDRGLYGCEAMPKTANAVPINR